MNTPEPVDAADVHMLNQNVIIATNTARKSLKTIEYGVQYALRNMTTSQPEYVSTAIKRPTRIMYAMRVALNVKRKERR
jgi:hypothetical protein